MGSDLQNRFSIGEMAAIHQTTIKTLRYYDQIDLFKPAIVAPDSGYRYYTTEQFEQLNTIQYLKQLGLSLKEIKAHLDKRDINHFKALLQEQQRLTEAKIQDLERVKHRFENRIADLDVAQKAHQLEVPFIKTLPERYAVKLTGVIHDEPEFELSLRQLQAAANLTPSIFIGGVGLSVAANQVLAHHYHNYNAVFIFVDHDDTSSQLRITIPAGRYVCCYYNGNHSDSDHVYDAMLASVSQHGAQVTGNAIERTIIDQYVSSLPKDYLTEIQMPVSD